MVILNNGNIGIGTTLPDALLKIESPSSDVTGNSFVVKASGGKEFFSISKYGFLRSRASDTNGANMHFFDNAGSKRMEMSIDASQMTWYSDALTSNFLTFQHTTGNIGIGTTAPSAKLQIKGSDNSLILDVDSAAFGGRYALLPGRFVVGTVGGGYPEIGYNFGTSGSVYTKLSNDTSWGINFGNSSVMSFKYNGAGTGTFSWTTFMTIKNDGNVGIGTTSPAVLLHLENSNSTYTSPANTNVPAIYVNNLNSTTSTAHAIVAMRTYGANGGNPFVSWDINGVIGWSMGIDNADSDKLKIANNWSDVTSNTRVTITTGGNIGIGTTNPTARLHVVDSNNTTPFNISIGANANYQFQANSTSGYSTTFNINDTGLYIGHNSAGRSLNLQTNSTDRITILGDGNVGIGTTNPSARLSLGSATNGERITWNNTSNIFSEHSSGDLWLSSNFYGNLGSSGYVTSVTATFGAAGINVSATGGGLNGVIKFFVDDAASKTAGASFTPTERMRITGGGNVGIGTTSPDYKLDVRGAGSIARITDGTSHMLLYAGSGLNEISTVSPLLLTVNSAERMRIQTDGNVGIGTTAPSINLQISSTNNNAVGSSTFWNFNFIGQEITNRSNTANTVAGLALIGGSGRSSVSAIANILESTSLGALGFFTGGSGIGGGTVPERMRIQSDGNVGIGTTSATAKLHIEGNTITVNTEGSAQGKSLYFRYSDGANIQSDSYLRFGTGGSPTEKMRIIADGNVGIGTTAPGAKLQVYGNLQMYAGSSGNSDPLVFGGETGTSKKAIFLESFWMVYQGHDNEGHKFRSVAAGGGYTDDMVITGGGNVGIGTTVPSSQIHVFSTAGSAAVVRIEEETGQAGVRLLAGVGSTNRATRIDFLNKVSSTTVPRWTLINDYNQNGTNDFRFVKDDQSTSILTLLQGGNVGIGTTSPISPLHVIGSARTVLTSLAGGDTLISAIAGVSNGYRILVDASNNITYTWSTGTNTTAMTILSGGNVGIGTTSPTRKLDVNGTSIFRDFTSVYAGAGNIVSNITWLSTDSGIMNIYTGGTAAVQLNSSGISYFNGGNVGIGTTSPATKFHVKGDAVDEVGLVLLQNDYASGNVYFPALSVINTRGNHSYGTVAEFRTNTSGDGDRPSILFYGAQVAASWQVGQVTSGWGTSDAFGIGYRASNTPGTFAAWPTNYFTILTGGNVGIGSTSPAYKLDVNGAIRVNDSIYFGTEIHLSGNDIRLQSGAANSEIAFNFAGKSNAFINVYNGSGGSRILLHPNGNSYFNGGNLGINTTTPQYKLDVNGGTGGGFAASFGGSISPGVFSGIHFGYLETGNTSYRKSALVFERTDNHGQGGNASGKIYMLLDNRSGNSATSLSTAVMTWDTDASATLGSARVGIGSTSPAYTLDVAGTIRATGDVIAYSDARVKDNINTIEAPLDLITKLRGVTYTRKDTDDKSRKVGVIAQEVLPILPEVVQKDTNGNYSVAYGNIVGVLIEAIKELKAEIDILKNK
jgi:hypothetical protein